MPAPSDSFPAGGPWPPKDLHHLAEVSSTVVGPVGRPADDTSQHPKPDSESCQTLLLASLP